MPSAATDSVIKDSKPISMTLGFFWALIWSVVIGVFVLTSIYFRFLVLEVEMTKINDRVEYVNTRIDRKVQDVEDAVEALHVDIDQKFTTLTEQLTINE